ncbi:DNA polymerase IV [Vallitalea okinawensis]|uniref:DNA polymerase IV n=1 Tax=Vallitalea okinawensis TaxID=2078660 RepID=UPI001300BB49|nr:DNA polymerase IV [Vallitalea okinawensis]
MRNILHVDMNSFFASCEQVIRPELKGLPVIVGGDPEKRRGIVLAASYEAKAFGVKTTMPIHEALKLCPEAILLKSTHGLYSDMSEKVMKIFDDYTPLKEQLSIDEAFLDMTGTEHLYGSIIEVAYKIQNEIKNKLDLGCSIGISSNKLLAKMASDYKKPMGITIIYPENVEEMLWPLPVGDLYGIGKKTTVKLKNLGVKTIGDLATYDRDELTRLFGSKYSDMMYQRSNGIDQRPVVSRDYYDAKSVGNELTFSNDINQLEELYKRLLVLSESVGYRLRKKDLKGKTISIKVKYNDFSVITRSTTIDHCTNVTDTIYKNAYQLLTNSWRQKPVRLLGVTVTNFEDVSPQTSLFSLIEEKQDDVKLKKVDQLTDDLRKKFGYNIVKRASTLHGTEHIRKH